MTEIDELSRVLGRIEEGLASLKKDNSAMWGKLSQIEATLTTHRIKAAGIAATVSAGMVAITMIFKKLFGGN
ncbi:MAG: hypothetical protein HY880_04145 [Deltaproteobacteria bacterium]|nr:hypothetical protein [Deltaproteobacteria bacterium]